MKTTYLPRILAAFSICLLTTAAVDAGGHPYQGHHRHAHGTPRMQSATASHPPPTVHVSAPKVENIPTFCAAPASSPCGERGTAKLRVWVDDGAELRINGRKTKPQALAGKYRGSRVFTLSEMTPGKVYTVTAATDSGKAHTQTVEAGQEYDLVPVAINKKKPEAAKKKNSRTNEKRQEAKSSKSKNKKHRSEKQHKKSGRDYSFESERSPAVVLEYDKKKNLQLTAAIFDGAESRVSFCDKTDWKSKGIDPMEVNKGKLTFVLHAQTATGSVQLGEPKSIDVKFEAAKCEKCRDKSCDECKETCTKGVSCKQDKCEKCAKNGDGKGKCDACAKGKCDEKGCSAHCCQQSVCKNGRSTQLDLTVPGEDGGLIQWMKKSIEGGSRNNKKLYLSDAVQAFTVTAKFAIGAGKGHKVKKPFSLKVVTNLIE